MNLAPSNQDVHALRRAVLIYVNMAQSSGEQATAWRPRSRPVEPLQCVRIDQSLAARVTRSWGSPALFQRPILRLFLGEELQSLLSLGVIRRFSQKVS
jgi:hypothetical protein